MPTPIVNLGPSVIGISILGAPLLGKTRLALKLAQKFRMEVVSIPTTLKRAIDFVKSKKEASTPKEIWMGKLGEEIIQMESEETAEEEDPIYLRIGESRNLAFALVEQVVELDSMEYSECGGWICDGWPRTKEQVMLLEFGCGDRCVMVYWIKILKVF